MTEFLVASKPCANCLFSDKRLVIKECAQDIIQQCLDNDKHFVCHNSTYNQENPKGVCCRLFFDKHKRDVFPIRLAILFNLVREVELKPAETLIQQWSLEEK